jgi:phosphatidylinositol alpha-mannosyltransferase
MRIALLSMYLPGTHRSKTGGVFYFSHHLANALVDAGNEVTVVSLDKKPKDATYHVITVKIPSFFHNSRFFKYYIYPFMLNQIDFSNFDIIHSNGDDWALFSSNKKILRTFHGSALQEAKHSQNLIRKINHYLLYLLEQLSLYKVNMAIGVSRNTTKDFKKIDDIIYNPINDIFFNYNNLTKSQNPSILFVGTIEGRKRGSLLIEQFLSTVLPKNPSAILTIVAEKKIEHPNIRSFTYVDDETLVQLYRESWVFCLPSSYEGFGIPYVEAMASEAVVVATDNPGAKEVLKDGEFGFIVKETELGNTLNILLNNKSIREEYIQKGKKRAQDFKMKTIVNKYMEAYQKCLN